jgi:hypothetical protein
MHDALMTPEVPTSIEVHCATNPVNTINVIAPYKHLEMWVFDDARVGLVQEPFVSGADTIIDYAVRDIPGAEAGFILVFSGGPFPGYQIRLDWRRAQMDGNWYYCEAFDLEGWLCPALLKYFTDAPGQLFVQCKPRGSGEDRN